jgi:cell fate (sporulation/competence/biofilm development) regulator YlbF (YheA/YmcA/DUF963 family)
MTILAEETAVISKTKELCAEIIADPKVSQLLATVERFLTDDAARLQYQSVHERGEELNQKQRAGMELGSAEIREFETAREALFNNEIACDFMAAQRELEAFQKEITTLVGLTLELGHVPSDDEIAAASGGGCCGGGGCGC